LIKDIIPADKYNKNLMNFCGQLSWPRAEIRLLLSALYCCCFLRPRYDWIMRSFNKNYIGFQKRTGLEDDGPAIKLTLLIMDCCLPACSCLSCRETCSNGWYPKCSVLKSILVLRWVLIVNLIFYIIAFIYKYAPAVNGVGSWFHPVLSWPPPSASWPPLAFPFL